MRALLLRVAIGLGLGVALSELARVVIEDCGTIVFVFTSFPLMVLIWTNKVFVVARFATPVLWGVYYALPDLVRPGRQLLWLVIVVHSLPLLLVSFRDDFLLEGLQVSYAVGGYLCVHIIAVGGLISLAASRSTGR